MSSQKYISVKSCGNPQSAGGFMTLTLFNSPSFAIEDRAISGFQANSYFFSLMIEKTQVVYKLYKNNVRSFGSIRPGTLVIAFSVPRDYRFEDGINPYNVMISLKDKFLSACMTCRDPKLETYEFNEGQIDSKILDSVAEQYPLVPHDGPYCEMSTNGPIGHLILPEKKIEQFMNNIHYRELQQYSEIFIAEEVEARVTSQGKESSPVPDLEIPRSPQYKISVDGKARAIETDTDKLLSFSSQADERYYNNGHVAFTIKDLQNGRNPDRSHVTFDPVHEEIQVSTTGLAEPRTKRFYLILEPYQQFFMGRYNQLQLSYCGNNKLKLDEDLSFELKGDQIGYCNRLNAFSIKYYGEDQLNYSFDTPRIDEDRLVYTVVKKEYRQQPLPYKPGGNRRNPHGEPQQRIVPRRFVFHFEDKDKEIFNKTYSLRFRVKSDNDVFDTTVNFSQKGKANYEGVLEVPEQIQNPMTIEYRTPDGDLYGTNPLSIDMNDKRKNELSQSDFFPVKERFMDRKISKHLGLLGLLAAALLMLGGVAGYVLRGCTQNGSSIIEKKIIDNKNGEGGQKSIDKVQNDPETKELTEEQAVANMAIWLQTLERKNVTFKEIEDINNQYMQHQDDYTKYCKEDECKKIEDYNNIKTLIVNGVFEQLKNLDWEKWQSINYDHRCAIDNATYRGRDDGARKQFLANYKDYTSFSDIKAYDPKKPSATGGGSTTNNGGGKTSGGQGETEVLNAGSR